ncbi:MAG: type II toxin-antitoxin system death-on-curing family toxin [Caulobacterales bacterium]
MTQPVWLLKGVVLAVHDMLLAEHGGPAGVRDDALLESALARPINLHAYGDSDLCALAAAYAFGIVGNHPFVDGNKRTGFLAAYIFLKTNGLDLIAGEADATAAVLALASGEAGEAEFAAWLRANVRSA